MSDLTTRDGVTDHMSKSASEDDWNKRCDEVVAANGGYPNFWYEAVVMSGLAEKTLDGGSSEIEATKT